MRAANQQGSAKDAAEAKDNANRPKATPQPRQKEEKTKNKQVAQTTPGVRIGIGVPLITTPPSVMKKTMDYINTAVEQPKPSGVVYRGLSERDTRYIDSGIMAADPTGTLTEAEHILSLDGDDQNSPWISTTKDPAIAAKYAVEGRNPSSSIVAIDLGKINSQVRDVSQGGTGNPVADTFAVNDREVLVRGMISRDAIISITRVTTP